MISNFSTIRQYPNLDCKQTDLITQYFNNIALDTAGEHNINTIAKNIQHIRIMTYNVHFWTNPNEDPNIDNIIDTILTINPDVLCLQEVLYSKLQIDGKKLLDKYEIKSFCNITPSWFNDVYGNMILIDKTLLRKLKKQPAEQYFSNNVCGKSNRCFLGQFNYIYDSLNCCQQGKSIVPLQGAETRCFIKISLPQFDIICTHLEAYNTETRVKQLTELNKFITRPTIVLGDFNMICENDYVDPFKTEYLDTSEYKKYKEQAMGYKTLENFTDNKWTDTGKDSSINMTTWNGTRIDYIFNVVPQYLIDVYDELLSWEKKLETTYATLAHDYTMVEAIFKNMNTKVFIHSLLANNKILLSEIKEFFNKNKDVLRQLVNLNYKTSYNMVNVTDMLTKINEYLITPVDDYTQSSTPVDAEDIYVYIDKLNNEGILDGLYQKINTINNLLPTIAKYGVYFSNASDHLPIFVDIPYSNVMLIPEYNEKLKDIETAEHFEKYGYIEITKEQFLHYWNLINDTTFDITNIVVYNGQVSYPNVIDWIGLDSHVGSGFELKDPYNFGTSKGSNSMGNMGIYGAASDKQAIRWGQGFMNDFKKTNSNRIASMSLEDKKKIETLLLHEFQLMFSTDIKICYVGSELEWKNYPEDFDEKYDIIVGEMFTEVKITKKSFDESTRKFGVMKLLKKYTTMETVPSQPIQKQLIVDEQSYNMYEILPIQEEQSGGNYYKQKYLKYANKNSRLRKMFAR